MNTKPLILAGFAIMVLTGGTAQAGPCDTDGRAANPEGRGFRTHRGQYGADDSVPISTRPTSTMNRARETSRRLRRMRKKQIAGPTHRGASKLRFQADRTDGDKGC